MIAAGLPKISNMSAGAAPAGNASAKVEEKKAEAKVEEPEEEEEEDVDMGDLFGDFWSNIYLYPLHNIFIIMNIYIYDMYII